MNDQKPIQSMLDPGRLKFFYLIMAIVFGFYIFRLFSLQVINGAEYLERADINRTTTINVPTQRGIIYDRNGFVLARNTASYNVTIVPAYLPSDEGAIQEVYRELSELINIPVNHGETTDESVRLFKPCETDLGITQIVYIGKSNAPYDPVRIKCNIDEKTARIIREKAADLSGVEIEVEAIREYPTGSITAEIIGFLGPIPATLEEYYTKLGFVTERDKVGYSGVELSLQKKLGGTNGKRVVEVDVAGKELRDLQPPIDAVPGYNVKLTIDTRLQMAAKQALIGEINDWNLYFNEIRMANGVTAVINPKTGEILALVSYPSYENNRMARLIPAYYYQQLSSDPNRPLFNHAISAELAPGSVFKLATALGILNEGTFTLHDHIECPGVIQIMQKYSPNDPGTPRDYVCYNEAGHGIVDFYHGLAWSCDIFFYKVSGGFQNEVPEGLGIWRLAEYAKALGYGDYTGINLEGEQPGLVPDPDWKRIDQAENWATGDTYITAMGQGFVLATPLQVLVSAAIVSNDGKYYQPTLLREVLDSEGRVVEPFKPQLKWDLTKDARIRVFDEDNVPTGEMKVVEKWVIDATKQGMKMVVEAGGTGEIPFKDMAIHSAGKTGTAEYCDNVAQAKDLCKPGNWPTHSWYVGYAPYDDPEIAVVGFVYNGGEGASVAAPVVRKVMDAYFELKAIDAAKGGQVQ